MATSKWIGKSLSNRYVIEEILGQGGMSAVFKATDPNLKRVVAVKVIHPHLSAESDFVQRFEDEATAVAQLRHPGIIQVYDFNHDDDTYYMVLEFVPGETLQDHLKRLNTSGRKLSITNAIEYMADLCDAVDYAHQRGMVHRDIKPANIMVNVMGQVILMDFGIAKIVGGQRHTATGAVVGTAMYMSPEQIKGQHPDRRTDIYSLGVTLFEMVSGKPPFEADSAMTLMMMHVNDPIPDPRSLNPDVPDDLVAVINKALAKNPDARFQTAAQMAAALRNILARMRSGASAPVPAPGATMVEDSPISADSGGTFLETPVARAAVPVGGTVVENTPMGDSTMHSKRGTTVEPVVRPGATSLEPAISPTASTVHPPPATAPAKKMGIGLPLIIGGLVGLACLGFGVIFLITQLFNNPPSSAPTESVPIVPVSAVTDTALPEPTATIEVTVEPSATATITNTPEPTVPPGIPYVRINSITIDSNNRYVVEYETFEYTEVLPGMHVHFFFDTVTPQNAGSPGSGPWILYGGPRPFTEYRVSDKPAAATQMCALVANANHSIQMNSGNCMDLP
ncbi:MAG: protein kinase [Chloroflexota bacterium]